MKRFLLSLVLAMCLWSSSWAEIIAGSCGATSDDKVTYSYNTETCHLVVEGKGTMGVGWRESVPYISLKTAKIKEGITSLDDDCFDLCSSMTSITIPEGVTSLGWGCFGNCSSLTNITIPKSVTTLGWSCFAFCKSLTSISLPDGITSMGDRCFEGCRSLTSISLPDGITSLGKYCFYGCSSLTSISFPDGITSMGDWCFGYCTALTSISLPDGITSLGPNCFCGCSLLTSISLPDGIIGMGYNCFRDCSSLTSITIPKGVTHISDNCFEGCSSLTSITLPDGITSMGEYCFKNCSSLTSIPLPEGVASLEKFCFDGCTSLTTMVCHSNTPPSLSSNVFRNVPTDEGTLYVPQTAISAYRNDAGWAVWDKILPIKEDPITPEEPEDKKVCKTPTIRYEEGKLQITSATDGAKCYYSLITADTKTELSEISEFVILEAAYKITAIAKCEGYEDSEKSTATLYWLSGSLDSSTGIESLAASRGVIASCHDGLITLTGLNNNERVQFYSINGVYLGACNAADGGVQFAASRYSGYVIAKVGTHSLRIAVR